MVDSKTLFHSRRSTSELTSPIRFNREYSDWHRKHKLRGHVFTITGKNASSFYQL